MMMKREEETIMLVRWFSSYKYLMSSLVTWVQSLGFTQWKERNNTRNMSIVAHTQHHYQPLHKNICNKGILQGKIKGKIKMLKSTQR